MTKSFLELSASDRQEALQVAASASGRPMHILEKDVWVVWTLSALFSAPFGKDLVFKGGTSLSKAFKAIQRFSEDIDVTYDIRAIAADLVGDAHDAHPKSKSQGRKWSDEIRERRLPKWLAETALPHLQQKISESKLATTARADRECIYLEYETQAPGYGYVASHIKVEFGARSTGEPADERPVECDAAEFLAGLSFPTATPRVMRMERTIWEKMTAIHVFCLQEDVRNRLARHWYDIAKLDAAGHVDSALKATDIAQHVATHKSWFFPAKDAKGNAVDYQSAVGGGVILVPRGKTLDTLASDYARMIEDGLFLGEPESFDWVIERCREIETKANAIRNPSAAVRHP
jgi:hypothetical protein